MDEQPKNRVVEKVVYVEKPSSHKCITCGAVYDKQDRLFPKNKDKIYEGNNFYLPVCTTCFKKDANDYEESLGSTPAAIRRMCAKWDYYISEKTISSLDLSTGAVGSSLLKYIRLLNIAKDGVPEKTHDDYLQEIGEDVLLKEHALISMDEDDLEVMRENAIFFGDGYTQSEYRKLRADYEDWISKHESQTKAQEEIFKNLCIASLNIQRAQRDSGSQKNAKDAMKTFQELLSTANLQPKQVKSDPLSVKHTPGMLAKMIEVKKPIVLEDPSLKDVDNMARYHRVWFSGAMSNCFGIANPFAEEYEEELAKYTVQKPEYEEDGESNTFDSIFGEKDADE